MSFFDKVLSFLGLERKQTDVQRFEDAIAHTHKPLTNNDHLPDVNLPNPASDWFGIDEELAKKLGATSRNDFLYKGLKAAISGPPNESGDWNGWNSWTASQQAAASDDELSVEVLDIQHQTPILVCGELSHIKRALDRVKTFCIDAGNPDKAKELEPIYALLEKWRKDVKELKWTDVNAVDLRTNRVLYSGDYATNSYNRHDNLCAIAESMGWNLGCSNETQPNNP